MAQRLDAREPAFPRAFAALLEAKREAAEDVDEAARAIVADVASRGDAALLEYTKRFDGLALTPATLRIAEPEIDAAVGRCPPDTLAALKLAGDRIEAYHRAQRPEDARTT